MHIFGSELSGGTAFLLLIALGLALSFEFVNGFHDTANAVATVIYTHSLKPTTAVVYSGLLNLLGVLTSSGLVAFSIVSLLPVELVLNVGSGAGFAMVFALLISAIIWNLGTWYLGLPASSSHTLVGSIMGVGLANSLLTPGHVFGEGVNWGKAYDVFASLVVSPIVGFALSALLLLAMKFLIKSKSLYQAPKKDQPPPWPIRGLLWLTCGGVSFFHGSNDGQKGMGLIVLILVGVVPATFALNPDTTPADIAAIVHQAQAVQPIFSKRAPARITGQEAVDNLSDFMKNGAKANDYTFASLSGKNADIAQELGGKANFDGLTPEQRKNFRIDIYLMSSSVDKLIKGKMVTDPADVRELHAYSGLLQKETKYIPTWVKFAVALALGLGTMIGWKRIVVTVGEKIGKEHLTYAQGASAEIIAMATIGMADKWGLPVSTTHVLSSGVAGTMFANRSGLQMDTLRNLLLAWVLTLPVCVLLGAAIFSFSFYILLHVLGVH